jgi:hypothetical protein
MLVPFILVLVNAHVDSRLLLRFFVSSVVELQKTLLIYDATHVESIRTKF